MHKLVVAAKGQAEQIRPELKDQFASHIGSNGGAKALRGHAGVRADRRIVRNGEKIRGCVAENPRGVHTIDTVITTAQIGLAHGAETAICDGPIRDPVVARVLMECGGKQTIARKAVTCLAQHRGAEALAESSGIDAVVRIGISELSPAGGKEGGRKDDREYLRVRGIDQFVPAREWFGLLARIHVGVPLSVRMQRICRTDVYAEDGVVTASADHLRRVLCRPRRLRFRSIRQRRICAREAAAWRDRDDQRDRCSADETYAEAVPQIWRV